MPILTCFLCRNSPKKSRKKVPVIQEEKPVTRNWLRELIAKKMETEKSKEQKRIKKKPAYSHNSSRNSKHVSTVASDSLLRNCVARLAATSNWFIAAPLSMRQQLAGPLLLFCLEDVVKSFG